MNFNVLKLGFQSFLQEKLAKENKEANFSLSDVSIFMYADEFKEYITDELNLSSSTYSMDISDILEMEFDENGKLVDPNAVEKQGEEAADSTETAEEGVQTADATAQEDPNMLADMMNDLLKDKTFSDAIDADGDGEVTEEEFDAFLNAIKANDNDESNLSLEDLMTATQQIKDNEFSMKPAEEDTAPQVEPPTQSPQSGNMGGGDFVPTQNNNNNNQTTETPKSTESLEGKSLTELKDMLPTREDKLESAQTAVDEAIDAVHNNEAQEAVDEAFNNYVEFLE